MEKCTIVGGGVSGILAALLAREKFSSVTLIERSHELGGLLGSFTMGDAIYDYGTHLPALTGRKEIDEIMYGPEEEIKENWDWFPYLRSENFHNNKWNPESPLIDTRTLPEDLYLQGLNEITQLPGVDHNITNLDSYLRSAFGDTFTDSIYKPLIQKIQGKDPSEIHKDILTLFGIHRVMAFTPETTKELKKIPRFDGKLGFHSYKDGAPSAGYIYPKGFRGIGYWITTLKKKLEKAGVEIVCGESIDTIQSEGDTVKSVKLTGGKTLDTDMLVWTVPAAFAFKALKMKTPDFFPEFRHHVLCHYEFNKPLLKKIPQYLLVWDNECLSYRITLYPNVNDNEQKSDHANLTVEILGDASMRGELDHIQEKVEAELKAMKVVDKDAEVIQSKTEYLGPSFPILTEAFIENAQKSCAQLEERFSNLRLMGRGSGKAFFINQVMIDTYDTMMNEVLPRG